MEQIANATLEVEKIKKMRAESLKASGWNNPWELLSGAVETTGTALKRVDVLGVGTAAGVVVGAGAMVGGAAGRAVGDIGRASVKAGVKGVNTVIGVGSDVTLQTGRMLVTGVGTSSRAVTGVATGVAGGVVDVGKFVTKPVVGAGKVVAKTSGKVVMKSAGTVGTVVTSTAGAVGTVVTSTAGAVGTVVTSTGKVMASIARPLTGGGSGSKTVAPTKPLFDADVGVPSSVESENAGKTSEQQLLSQKQEPPKRRASFRLSQQKPNAIDVQ